MKTRIIFKSIFLVILLVILGCLIFIINDKAGKAARIYNPLLLSSYTIFYDNEGKDCMNNPEVFYKDSDYNYYLTCLGSYNIYLEWTDGSRDLLKNALNNKKVNMASLIEHGLEVVKHEK